MCSDSGMIGGVPCPLPNFGSSYNPECTLEHNATFDIIDGGGLNMTCLGLGECDEDGNINVSKFGSRLIGPGGFIDITSATKKVVFCGTFMGKQKTRVGDGRLVIEQAVSYTHLYAAAHSPRGQAHLPLFHRHGPEVQRRGLQIRSRKSEHAASKETACSVC